MGWILMLNASKLMAFLILYLKLDSLGDQLTTIGAIGGSCAVWRGSKMKAMAGLMATGPADHAYAGMGLIVAGWMTGSLTTALLGAAAGTIGYG